MFFRALPLSLLFAARLAHASSAREIGYDEAYRWLARFQGSSSFARLNGRLGSHEEQRSCRGASLVLVPQIRAILLKTDHESLNEKYPLYLMEPSETVNNGARMTLATDVQGRETLTIRTRVPVTLMSQKLVAVRGADGRLESIVAPGPLFSGLDPVNCSISNRPEQPAKPKPAPKPVLGDTICFMQNTRTCSIFNEVSSGSRPAPGLEAKLREKCLDDGGYDDECNGLTCMPASAFENVILNFGRINGCVPSN